MANRILISSIVLMASAIVAGCAAESPSSDEAVTVSAEELSTRHIVPSQWQHQPGANLSCSTSASGSVTSRSSRHYFSFPGTARQQTTFTVDGQWPARLGAAVIVTDNSYNILGSGTSSTRASARVEVTFASDAKYFVFIAPLQGSVSRRYDYTLTAGCRSAGCLNNSMCAPGEQCEKRDPRFIGPGTCVARPLCVQVNAADGRFVAKNFPAGSYAEADAWAQSTAGGGAYGISLATCAVVAQNRACTEQYQPVCGVSPSWENPQNFGNKCFFEGGIIAAAGDSWEAAGKAADGECAAPGNPVCATYYIDAPLTTSPTYYVQNMNSAAEAEAFLALATNGSKKTVLNGACESFQICTKEYNPVCGTVRSEPKRTFGNRCSFEATVRANAGSAAASKGLYTPGACN